MARDSDPDQSEFSHAYEIDPEEQPSEAVIAAIAKATSRSPLTMEPLAEAIDPDGVDTLLSANGDDSGALAITFEYGDVQVTVTPTTVRIDGYR